MDATLKVDPKQFSVSMKSEKDSYLEPVMQAVISARGGEWIASSEKQVRNFSVEFRQRIFEQAVQQRIDAVEAVAILKTPNDSRQWHLV